MDDLAHLQAQAEGIRTSRLLGQSRLIRLFNYLVKCSSEGTTPKEAAIAVDVFGKTSSFDVSQDAIVRVYIHNLRRKLDLYYSGAGSEEKVRLVIPKGEYRLSVEPWGLPPKVVATGPPRISFRRNWLFGGAIAGLVLVSFLLLTSLSVLQKPHGAVASVRSHPFWARLMDNGKPTVVVLGDYYIFGDTDRSMDVKRLVREFSINSRDDLFQYLMANPDLAARYMDVGLGYLPLSSAFALANVLPILAAAEKPRVRVVMMSQLSPELMKGSNIVYIGLLSGLGSLKGVVFAASRFSIGDSYDEIIDRTTKHRYISEATQYEGTPMRFANEPSYRDYGFVSTFSGLGGNQIVIIAGTQDEGVRQTAEAVTDRARLDELTKEVNGRAEFEGLLEVSGLDRVNLSDKLLIASPLDTTNVWSAGYGPEPGGLAKVDPPPPPG